MVLLAAAAVAVAVAGAPPPAAAQAGVAFKKAPPNTDLRVFASAQVKSPFNSAMINLGITVERPTLQATIAASRYAMAIIRRKVTAASIPARDVVTRDVALRAKFNYSSSPRVLLGWSIDQQVRVTTDRVGAVEGLLRTIATTVGQNVLLRISSRREVGSTDDLVLRALREATLAARSKADRIAAATGKKVKRVIYLGGNKGNWPRQYASNGLYTVACQVNGKFLLVTPGKAVSGGTAEERLKDIVRVGAEEGAAVGELAAAAAMAEADARPDVHMEVSGTTEGEAPALYGGNPAEREYDSVVELKSIDEAMDGVF